MAQFKVARKDGVGSPETVEAVDLMTTCERLSQGSKHALDITPVGAAPAVETIQAPADVAPTSPVNSTWTHQVTDETAKARIEAQHATIAAHGVTVPTTEQLYSTGTRMADVGYATQAGRKVEHDVKLPFAQASEALRAAVESEKRIDRQVTAGELGRSITVNGKIAAFGLALSEQAIRGLCARVESPALGYVLGVRERIATEHAKGEAKNSNVIREDKARIAEVLAHECRRNPDVVLQLRTREAIGDVFAVVSPGYVPADAPAMLDEIRASQLPSDAKATWSYDPTSTAWEVRASVWTPVPTDVQAVGEAFEGYVSLSSRDNGTSRFRGGGGISLLRCLNASTYAAEGSTVARVHRGGVLRDIDVMLRSSLTCIHALCEAWGIAREDVLTTPDRVTINDAIPGFWRYCLSERSGTLAGVLPGRKETHVDGLTAAWRQERRDSSRVVRSDLAQGWTRYIQDQAPPVRRDAEVAIGKWLVSRPAVGCDLRS